MAQIEPTTAAAATKLDGDLSLKEGTVYKGKAIAKPTDTPVRDDLPVGHPLRGTRALRVVPSGMGDCLIAADGKLMSAVEVEEKPLEKPEEVVRGR